MKKIIIIFLCTMSIHCSACSDDDKETSETDTENNNTEMASITSVTTSGTENNYTFNVGIKSPDLGCEQYADWWEIITEDGSLLYRRILAHSHVNEQPFIRSGGSVPIANDKIVIVRAHMNTSGYGETVFKGSIADGFTQQIVETSFASQLATTAPLPNGCAF